ATVHHLGLYRDSHSLAPIEYYNKLPASPTHSLYIVLDPMVATGGTATAVLAILKDWGVTRVKLVAVCASKKSLESLQNQFPEAQVYVGVVDETLNDQGYVVPGIGDSGDRLYNTPHVE
ncbi:uracil phosphoribosyltransferase-domain-containing protein, partial [Piptocephalis cylindrospora]